MALVYLGLGSNVGDRDKWLRRARILVNMYIGPICLASKVYMSAPWGEKAQPDFLNQVVATTTKSDVEEIYRQIEVIESHLGKTKTSKYGPRNIDIDLLLRGDTVYHSNSVVVPHPMLHQRRFVLVPLAEIASEMIHPGLKSSIKDLLLSCTEDQGHIEVYS